MLVTCLLTETQGKGARKGRKSPEKAETSGSGRLVSFPKVITLSGDHTCFYSDSIQILVCESLALTTA